MRAASCLAASTGLAALFVVAPGCLPDKDKVPDWQQAPKAFDVRGADLTFNSARIEAFNAMEPEQREAHLAELTAKPGSFKGQAIFKRGSELGEKMDDLQYGTFEIYAVAPGPDEVPKDGKGIWLELTIEYHLFAEKEFTTGWPPGSYIEFTGTFADMAFQYLDVPRKMEIKVKVDDVKILKD